MESDSKYAGLVADLLPNIRCMQFSGHFFFNYCSSGSSTIFLRKIYSTCHLILVLVQFMSMLINLALNTSEVNELTANTITVLFFLHCITKFIYFALNSKTFYRSFNIWNTSNSHPLFAESNDRYHRVALGKMRKLLIFGGFATITTTISWITITFFDESVALGMDKTTNETFKTEVPRLPIKGFYPGNPFSGTYYYAIFGYQIYYLVFSMMHANLLDVLFCSWLIFACEQLQHLKHIMKPLMELSASLDTFRPNSAALFKSLSASSNREVALENTGPETVEENVYNTKSDWNAEFRAPSTLQNFNNGSNPNPNGLSRKQEMMVRSAIKYWVERHKHVVRLVGSIGDTYGTALLFHMLTSTINLTLLAYQATKINGLNAYALSVAGYLVYALSQVFHFCIFGNRLIEESSSVMEAAYSCHWYDGSEEAKTFVQIVCQQCQKAMSISGAKFFTVSLDLFASVLGAVVTYFMVLVQLK